MLAFFYTGTNYGGQSDEERNAMVGGRDHTVHNDSGTLYTLPVQDYSNHYIKISYTSNSRKGGSGHDNFFTTEKIEFTSSNDKLKERVADDQKKADASTAAKVSARSDINAARKAAEEKIANNPTWTNAEKATEKQKVEDAYTASENFFNDQTSLDAVNPDKIKEMGTKTVTTMQGYGNENGESIADRIKDARAALSQTKLAKDAEIAYNKDLTKSEATGFQTSSDSFNTSFGNQLTNIVATDKDAAQKIFDIENDIQTKYRQIVVKGGKSFSDSSKQSTTNLTNAYNDAKSAIQNNKTLTHAQITGRLTDLQNDYTKALADLQAAKKTQDLETVASNFADKIAVDEKDLDRNDQLQKLINDFKNRSDYENQRNAILNDKTIDTPERNRQLQALDAAYNAVIKRMNNATKITDAEDTSSDTGAKTEITTIKGTHKSGDSIPDQIKKGQNAMDQQGTDADNTLAGMTNLSKKEQAVEKAKIDALVADAKKAYDGNADADAVEKTTKDSTLAAQIQAILDADRKKTITDLKNDAKDAIDGKAKQAKDDIDKRDDLNQDEKNKAKDAIDNAAGKAKTKVDGDNNADDIDTDGDVDPSKDTVDGLKGHPSLDDQKNKAKGDIDDAANKAKQAIDNNPNLPKADKDKHKADIDKAAKDAKGKIDGSKNADDLNGNDGQGGNAAAAKGDFKKAADGVNDDVNHHDSLDKQKNDAKKGIDDDADKAKTAIDNNPNLPQSDKDKDKAAIDDAAKKAKGEIDGAKDADDLHGNDGKSGKAGQAASDFDSDKNKVDGDVNKHESLDDQKKDAKGAIDNDADKAKKAIDNNPNLPQPDKDKAKAKIDDAAKDAKKKIDGAQNADDLHGNDGNSGKAGEAAGDFKKAADDVKNDTDHHESFDDQKKDAKKGIDDAADKAKKAIDDNPALPEEDKAKHRAEIDDAAKKAKDKIDGSKDAADLHGNDGHSGKAGDAAGDFKKASDDVNDDVKKHKSLDDQKKDAKNNIDNDADKEKKAIDDDPNLPSDDKKKDKDAIDDAAKKAKNKIDGAKNADDLNGGAGKDANADFNKAKGHVDDDMNNHKPFDDQKKDAKSAIDNDADKAKKAIDDNPALPAADKAKHRKQIDDAAKKAKDKIDGAKTPDDLNNGTGKDGKDGFKKDLDDINDDVKKHKSLADQKKDAKADIDDKAKKAKEAIDNLPNVPQADKDKAKAAIDDEAQRAKNRMDGAGNIDDLDAIKFDTSFDHKTEGIVTDMENKNKTGVKPGKVTAEPLAFAKHVMPQTARKVKKHFLAFIMLVATAGTSIFFVTTKKH
ncbi:DUF1542 domain-containing protein [Fructobacillus sp. W13]|uniref:DUF1542 domain-containing protein n=1 Tax=Fructobacillus apis TaxID=2935017 RepID=A0ABT0ZP42_9LACO|nr:DUF1542 domain-containing protein [Fructobacillus apis]MCO0831749.1 DUF1542 domain-containing protein [Fructobacillus apis]